MNMHNPPTMYTNEEKKMLNKALKKQKAKNPHHDKKQKTKQKTTQTSKNKENKNKKTDCKANGVTWRKGWRRGDKVSHFFFFF